MGNMGQYAPFSFIKVILLMKFIYLLLISFCFNLNLTLIDYHDPQANHILDAEVYENTLIVSAFLQGIEFYDISNSGELNHISHFSLSGGGGGGGTKSNCVTTSNDYAYFTSNNGLFVVNISNPSNPINNGSVSGTGNLILENLKAEDGVLAVACHEDGVKLYDISNPSNPLYRSTIPTDNSWAVEIKEDFSYVADNENILVVNITNLYEPEIITSLNTGNAIKDVVIDGDKLYVALGSDGVSLYNIDNLMSPEFLGTYNTSSLANRLSAFDNKVAVSDWDDVEVLEWDGNNLNIVGYKNTTNRTMAIATKDNYIFSAEWASVQSMEYGVVQGPDLDLSSTYIIYPYVDNGSSFSMYIEAVNNGNEILLVSDNYTTNQEFEIINPLNELFPGQSQFVELQYNASNSNASGSYRIYSNDVAQPEIICPLVGNVDGANIGESAPDFNLEIVANGNGYFQLSDNIGQVVVLAFFAPN